MHRTSPARTARSLCRRPTAWVCVLVLGLAPEVAAGSLAGRLHQFIDQNGFPTSHDFVEVVTPIVQRLALRGIAFPVTATTPSFSYRFNFDLGVPERTPESLGPAFAERANTVGRHRFDLGVSYLYANLTRFDGADFGKQILTAGVRTDPATGLQAGGAFRGTRFSLMSHVMSFSATYGVTDRWDVNLLVPLVWTALRLDGVAAAQIIAGGSEAHLVAPAHFSGDAFGFGDVMLRTKYRFFDGPVKLASVIAVRVPSGDARDFRGIGDPTVTPALIVSRAIRDHDVHASAGVEMNADDLQRTRARYAAGVTLQPWTRLACLLDLIGSSSFVDDEFTIPRPLHRSDQLFGNDELIESVGPTTVVARVPRSDVVDLAVGLKASFFGSGAAFVSAIFPVTNDGLRAEVVPAAGVEVSF